MSKVIMNKKYDGEQINDINDDIMEALDEAEMQEEHGIFKGYVKVLVQYVSPEDCECTGFQHREDCHNWVMSF